MADTTHKQGCDALGGYGPGVGPCSCGADAQPMAPTDAEIDALVAAYLGDCGPQATRVYSFVRAVLAKWGTPAVVGEVGACGNCGGTGWMVRDPDIGTDQECFVCDGSGRYSESATPQPTQAQAGAVPLTDEQIRAMAREYPAEDLHGWSYRMGVADAEALHGIKGGQHGADTRSN